MGWWRQKWIGMVSEISWRLPRWESKLLTGFSQAERGSCYDMLSAVEHTERRDLRLKYFRHAMDESRHAGIFLRRARALGGIDRTEAVMHDAGYLARQGIVGGESLIEQMGELGFLAFVHVAEADAVEQFNVYLSRDLPHPDTTSDLKVILKDERFHVTYSRVALEWYEQQGRQEEVLQALKQVRRNRFKERWLRFSVDMGHFMSSLWLILLYAFVLPFSLLARLESGGWKKPRHALPVGLQAARMQG